MAATTTATPIEHGASAFALSGKAKEAIKVGLAIVVTYWLALKFSWMSPTWAGIAVAVISQPGEGQSLYKGLLRAIGTFLAFFWSLVLLALFPQDRWMLFVGVSPVLGYIAYKMKGENDYLWYVAGFVTVMIITAGPQQPGHAFEFAAYRTMETLIGIGVWAVISSLLWPVTNLGALKSATDALLDAQAQVTQHGLELISHRGATGSPPELLAQEAQLVAKVGSLINVAASETYEVRTVRRSWLALQQASLKFMHTSNRLRLGAEDLAQIDMVAVLPGLADLSAELGARFAEARGLLAGKPSTRPCQDVSLELDRQAIEPLDQFQRAAVEVARTELEQLDAQTRSMVDAVGEIAGGREAVTGKPPQSTKPLRGPAGLRPIDRDQLVAAAFVVASVWVSALIWIYVNPPGHVAWVQFVPTLALAAMRMPHVRFFPLRVMGYAFLVGMGVYVFIMPHLSGFIQLAALLFLFTYLTDYYFAAGRMPLLLAMFIMLGITNEQSYNFAGMANSYLYTMMGIIVTFALTYMIGSPRPEKAFLHQTQRFFRSCEFLVSHLDPPESFVGQVREAYYRNVLRTLPAKMGVWAKGIDAKAFPKNSPEQVAGLLEALQLLAYRIDDLLDARSEPAARGLAGELGDSVHEWRAVVDQAFRQWSEVPEADPGPELMERLSGQVAALNAGIEQLFHPSRRGEISDAEGRSFYRLLGTYRGVARAGLVYAKQARAIDWAEWREERFE
jgi:uncharacterized membrane protein YccC